MNLLIFFLTPRGSDQAPSAIQTSKQAISSEAIPKSVSRVLNAAHVRQEWKEKKRKLASGEDTGEDTGKSKKRRIDTGGDVSLDPKGQGKSQAAVIQPGESLAHFNRCVLSTPSSPNIRISNQFLYVDESKMTCASLSNRLSNHPPPKHGE